MWSVLVIVLMSWRTTQTKRAKSLKNSVAKPACTLADVRVDGPTLENVFVAGLRALGEESKNPPFPGHHDHSDLHGQIAIGADNLTKQFGAFTAVKNVTLEIPYGEVYGLLGANGAGKTTTIRMLCGLLEATSGNMRLPASRATSARKAFVSRSVTCRRSSRSITT